MNNKTVRRMRQIASCPAIFPSPFLISLKFPRRGLFPVPMHFYARYQGQTLNAPEVCLSKECNREIQGLDVHTRDDQLLALIFSGDGNALKSYLYKKGIN